MVTVGIDPHKHVHVAVAVDAGGKRIGKPLTVKNDALLIVTLLTWIRSITDDIPVAWAIEDSVEAGEAQVRLRHCSRRADPGAGAARVAEPQAGSV